MSILDFTGVEDLTFKSGCDQMFEWNEGQVNKSHTGWRIHSKINISFPLLGNAPKQIPEHE